MCQPLPPLGSGKRCLIHSKATVAELHFVWAKTGVDKENIYAILKQLNKEGRKLSAPELAEVNEFLDKEEFKVKLDPDLSDRDRKMILKNLAKARDEAEEQGVTGGAFHAWKNVFKETVAKMKKPLVAMGLAGVLVAGIAGCAGSLNNDQNNTNSPTPTETVACSTENPGEYGDVIALKDVTDEQGTYCQTTIDPRSEALVYDASKVDVPSLIEYGFTEEDAKKAQETTVKFVTEEALDSAALDSTDPAAFSTWAQKNDSRFSGDWDVAATDGVVYSGSLNGLVRDGAPRSSETTISVLKIYAQGNAAVEGDGTLVVETRSTAKYRMSDDAAIESYITGGYTGTREALIAEHPDLADGVENLLIVQSKYTAGYNKEGKISGAAFTYSAAPITINNN
jgi:hypothetical protein